jgi:hypothetical protein
MAVAAFEYFVNRVMAHWHIYTAGRSAGTIVQDSNFRLDIVEG